MFSERLLFSFSSFSLLFFSSCASSSLFSTVCLCFWFCVRFFVLPFGDGAWCVCACQAVVFALSFKSVMCLSSSTSTSRAVCCSQTSTVANRRQHLEPFAAHKSSTVANRRRCQQECTSLGHAFNTRGALRCCWSWFKGATWSFAAAQAWK